jgi:hypothetical protein
MILPAYTPVQETIFGKAITAEENRLVDLLHTNLTFQDRPALAGLFEKRYGRYTFSEEPMDVPIDGFVETMAKYSFRAEAPLSEEAIER